MSRQLAAMRPQPVKLGGLPRNERMPGRTLKPDSPSRIEIQQGIQAGYLNAKGKPKGAGKYPFGIIPR
jgi:hypothetical protein